MREIKKIILHCSDSEFGDAELINQWHKARGWQGIGYHYVILNGYRTKDGYQSADDGLLENGRGLGEVGAHCKDQNHDSIGICLIGRRHFSAKQLYVVLPVIIIGLLVRFNIPVSEVYGHYEFNPSKTCPNIEMKALREILMPIFSK